MPQSEKSTEHFDQLYRDNYVKVYRLALGLTNRGGFTNEGLTSRRNDAEDITQEAFLRAFRSFHTSGRQLIFYLDISHHHQCCQ